MSVANEFLEPDETPRFMHWWPEGRTTHSVCPTCFAELERRAGRA
jgi:hypothetical protein